jgi:hypothetical protein
MFERTLNFDDLSVKKIIGRKDIEFVDLSLEEEYFLDSVVEISRSSASVYVKSEEILWLRVHKKYFDV